MANLQENLESYIDSIEENAKKFHEIVQGDVDTVVPVENGREIKSVANAMEEHIVSYQTEIRETAENIKETQEQVNTAFETSLQAQETAVLAKEAAVTAKEEAVIAKEEAVTAKEETVEAKNDFQRLYHGSSDVEPTERIEAGNLWFDTAGEILKVYNGSTWEAVPVTEFVPNEYYNKEEIEEKYYNKETTTSLIQEKNKIIAIHYISNNSAMVVNGSRNMKLFGGTFTKESSTSIIIANASVIGFGIGYDERNTDETTGYCNTGLCLDDEWKYDIFYDWSIGKHLKSSYSRAESRIQPIICTGICNFGTSQKGEKRIDFGWTGFTGSGIRPSTETTRPFLYLNRQYDDSGWTHGASRMTRTSTIVVYEIAE